MKTPAALLSLALTSFAFAQAPSAAQSTPSGPAAPNANTTGKSATPRIELAPDPKAPKAGDKQGAAAKDAKDPKAKDAKGKDAKKEEPAKIEGQEIARGGTKGFLGLAIVDGKFKLSFYDAKKKPVSPDVARVALRWDPKYKVGLERAVLTPAGKNTMSSEKPIRPPYNFKLWITMLKDAGEAEDPAAETHVIDFRQ